MIEIVLACPRCGRPVETGLLPATTSITCPTCSHVTPTPEAAGIAASGRLERCGVCGSPDLYVQKDFNRGIGLGIVAAGLALGPFTSWISAVAAVLLDAGLYLLVPSVAICYACEAQYRGYPPEAAPKGFEIAIHDAYKFGKRFPPRREAAVAGPLAKRLARERPPGVRP